MKQATTIVEQIKLLKERGIAIDDESKAIMQCTGFSTKNLEKGE